MKKIIIGFISLLLILTAVFGIYSLVKFLKTDIFLSAEKKSYLHWEFIKITARIKNKKFAEKYKNEPFYVSVYKEKDRIITIGGLGKIPLIYNNKKNLWEGNWPCPWNAADGKYHAEPFILQNIKSLSKNFQIIRRGIKRCFPSGFGVLTFENMTTLSKIKIINPDGIETDWRGMFDWTEFVGADAFWYLAGQTKAESPNADEHFPWIEKNISKLPELGKEAHNRKLKFGTYIISYLTFGTYKYKNYKYAMEYNSEKGGPIETRSISIADEKRVSDIIKLIKVFNEIPEIDYIGLDYLRNALGGYELVDEFVQDMDVRVPDGWDKFNAARKMGWLANEKVSRRNMNLIDQWQWWRAHKVSKIINRITKEVKLKKPLWLFTLTWEKGWQHGQDPIMFSDAGMDIDTLMLYEADRQQFDKLLDDWHNYIKKGQANLVLGNVVDWPLHQKILNPPGPEEFYNRLSGATKKIYNDRTADAVFVHDLARALWGRIKPYSAKEWLLAGAAAITEMRRLNRLLQITAEINLPAKLKLKEEFSIPIVLKNVSNKKQKNIVVKTYLIGGEILGENEKTITELLPGYTQTVNFRGIIKSASWEKDLKNMAAAQVKSDKRNATFFKYVTAK
ncbi:MAG: hypothetical protein COS68_07465 [Elusimicrobia bacterium CG06_land_8_20_14_3_00_38_11]|nr:MAG: hypothetical protein COS68_07465 [Elusimicrobia bacterium CG06_land_8_20_14_3_00_38_11]